MIWESHLCPSSNELEPISLQEPLDTSFDEVDLCWSRTSVQARSRTLHCGWVVFYQVARLLDDKTALSKTKYL